MQEAAERDVVIAFVGRPHRIDTRSRAQVRKALESIHMADYYLAEQKGWMLYVEGFTDFAILRRPAQQLEHPAKEFLSDSVPVFYLGNNKPQEARDYSQGLREAKSNLAGIALFDRLDKELHSGSALMERMWSRREIGNYITTPPSLRAYVLQGLLGNDLIDEAKRKNRLATLEQCVEELVSALRITQKPDPSGTEIKVTDDFLDPLFANYYQRLGIP